MSGGEDSDEGDFLAELRKRLPRMTVRESTRLPPAIVEAASKIHAQHHSLQGLSETVYLLAAADSQGGPRVINSTTGKWSIAIEEIMGDTENVMMVFRVAADLRTLFEGRRVTVKVGAAIWTLGVVDSSGIAEVEISSTTQLTDKIEVVVDS